MRESHPPFSNELQITRCYMRVRVAQRTVPHSPLAAYIYCIGDFFVHPTIEIRFSKCPTFTWSLAVNRKWRTTAPPPAPPKSKRVKIYIICKSSQLASLLKSLFTNLTPSLWVLRPNSTTGRNKYSASIVGHNHNNVPKKKDPHFMVTEISHGYQIFGNFHRNIIPSKTSTYVACFRLSLTTRK